MATFTASAFLLPPKAVHVATNTRFFSHLFAAATSAGDQVYLAKLPNKARITQCIVLATSGATGTNLNVSLLRGEGSASATTTLAVLGSFTAVATVGRFDLGNFGLPAGAFTKISLSDDAVAQFAVLSLHVTGGTNTVSISFNGIIQYTMDGD